MMLRMKRRLRLGFAHRSEGLSAMGRQVGRPSARSPIPCSDRTPSEGPQGGQRGFTLIELLIVVAILGVLAAVVLPNVGKFLGKGKTEAQQTELHNVQSAVIAMMTDAGITTIPSPVGTATNDMSAFPDNTTKNTANTANKYALWNSDPDDDGTADTKYITFATTTCNYTAIADGTVAQTCP